MLGIGMLNYQVYYELYEQTDILLGSSKV